MSGLSMPVKAWKPERRGDKKNNPHGNADSPEDSPESETIHLTE